MLEYFQIYQQKSVQNEKYYEYVPQQNAVSSVSS